MDIERIRRHVANIAAKLDWLENGDDSFGDGGLEDLHEALFIGVTVLEQEIGVTLFQADAGVNRSGGSGKERPDVSGQ